ncbi:MAG: hypothetical protein WBY28_04515 [Nitrososphaeraceae archaeon]
MSTQDKKDVSVFNIAPIKDNKIYTIVYDYPVSAQKNKKCLFRSFLAN